MNATTYLLRFEGVNFDATMHDTNDLSTVRGSSLALERAGAVVRAALESCVADVVVKTSGASKGAFTFTGDADLALKKARHALATTTNPPLNHLTFVTDVVEVAGGDETTALKHAEARNRAAQYRNWTFGTLPALNEEVVEYDRWEGTRPAETKLQMPRDKPRVLDPAADAAYFEQHDNHSVVMHSASVAARHSYGREERQKFYGLRIGEERAKNLHFTDSFEDIVGEPPEGLPISLCNKIAVMHIDGNSFSAILQRLKDKEFDRQIQAKHRDLLAEILRWYDADGEFDQRFHAKPRRSLHQRKAEPVPDLRDFRFETLLWGGEDIDLVMPSWLAFAFAESFFCHAAGWRFGTDGKADEVSHTMGVIICDRKTPIRLARGLAKRSVEIAKEATARANCVTFDIFEGIAPPDDGLAEHRARLYGLDRPADPDASYLGGLVLAAQLALPAADLGQLRQKIQGFKDGSDGPRLPRSKIFTVLQDVRRVCGGKFASQVASVRAHEEMDRYFRRTTGASGLFRDFRLPLVPTPVDLARELERACDAAKIKPPLPSKRSLALEFVLATQFWNYADPFDGELMPFCYSPA